MKQICKHCKEDFEIYTRDEEYYKNMGVPVVEKCPQCRFQLLLSYRNERTLYQRSCVMCKQPTLSMYSEDKPYTIYCRECWWSDKWDPLSYGREIDWKRPFFDQWAELRQEVPRIAMLNDSDSVNSEYTNHVYRLKNCYVVSDACDNEDSLFCNGIYFVKDCVDCAYVTDHSELCYETMFSEQCYNIRYSRDCHSCRDSSFLIDCVGVTNSFMCVGLRNKSFCFKNQELSEAEYNKKMQEYQLSSRSKVEDYKKEFAEFAVMVLRKYFHGSNNEDSDGDYIRNNKNVHHCFQTRTSENCSYCFGIYDAKECYDNMVWGEQVEKIYMGQAVGGQAYRLLFCNVVWHGQENYYGDNCLNGAQFVFGCISLKKQKYCILNKQYSEKDFLVLKDKLIQHMEQTGEWGNYFPIKYSLFNYNESHANEFFPLCKEEAKAKGWQWQDSLPGTVGKETIHKIPDDIADVNNSIIKEIVCCSNCKKNFKYVEAEFNFYKKLNIPLPDKCPSCRHQVRSREFPSFKLFNRQCMCEITEHNHDDKCPIEFKTTYNPNKPEIVYCEACYKKEIY
ncbi:MAG: hypothetical protein Q8P90_06245 [bacterium]|nr:hypothetical protein [bacterium]